MTYQTLETERLIMRQLEDADFSAHVCLGTRLYLGRNTRVAHPSVRAIQKRLWLFGGMPEIIKCAYRASRANDF